MKKAIIIFTRVPIPGKTKTRMMPTLTPDQCEHLHTCFLKDIRRVCEQCAVDIYVCYTPDEEKYKRQIMDILGTEKNYFPQKGNDLGNRMCNAFEEVLKKEYDSCLLIGTDVPELQTSCLMKAFEVLDKKDVVFGKTVDGGYYLVGMKKLYPQVFGLEQYGHSSVFYETLKRLQAESIRVGYTEELLDMDTPSDLQKYRNHMRENNRLYKTETGKYVSEIAKISIIIPVYNEEKLIVPLQRQLSSLKEQCEIILVDGGSTDKTQTLIEPGYRVISAEKGRANQMNQGALESTGDILFFLHCDSELPENVLGEIRTVMREYRAGCFGIAFRSKSPLMFICRVISNYRVKDRKVMFGDQGMFMERELFFELGMFPQIPIMEDYQLSLTLKEAGIKLGMANKRIYTSDRRYPRGMIPKLRLMWKMNRMRKMYRDKVQVQKLADMYEDIR